MNRNTALVASGILIFLVAIGVFFYKTADYRRDGRFAEGPPHHEGPPEARRRGAERMLEMLRDELQLTDEQHDKILKLHERNDIALTKRRYKVYRAMDRLKKELLNPEFNEQRVRKILEDIDVLKREDRLLFIKTRFEIKKLLTPAQARKYDRILDRKFRAFHRRFRHRKDHSRHGRHRRGRDE